MIRDDHAIGNRRRRLHALQEQLIAEVGRTHQPELGDLLSGMLDAQPPRAAGPFRVVIAGETKRGKSTLLNTLIGRPLLSPVGIDVTTACWLEVAWGEHDQAELLLANPASPAVPRRISCELRELENYVTLSETTEPILGAQVRVCSPLLRNLVLIDTPGVGGVIEGHAQAALTALANADALLFVVDARQPILAPEVEFLLRAVRRVPRVVVAVTKCDANPECESVVAETRRILAQQPELRTVPVFPVAPPLADRASKFDLAHRSALLLELSGMTPLADALAADARSGGDASDLAQTSRRVSTMAGILVRRAADRVADLAGDVQREQEIEARAGEIRELLSDRPRLSKLVRANLSRLSHEPVHAFDLSVAELRSRYQEEAERGPSGSLATLGPRLVADLTAAGVVELERLISESQQVLRQLLDEIGVTGTDAEIPVDDPGSFQLTLSEVGPPTTAGRTLPLASLAKTVTMFSSLVSTLSGAAVVVSVLTGPGVIAASIALAAGAGWWHLHGDSDQERRAQLRTWVDSTTRQTQQAFEREVNHRVHTIEAFMTLTLPDLLSIRERELSRLHAELTELRDGTEQTRRDALAVEQARLTELRRLAGELELLTARPPARNRKGNPS